MVAIASIVLDILAINETNKSHIAVTLFKIFILSTTLYLSIYHEFPGIWGNDPWLHNLWTQETIDLGHITPGVYISNDYYLFPFLHVWSAITQIVTQVSTYNAIFLSTGVLIVLSSLFAFLIGTKLVNVKVGLLVTLLVSFTDQAISRSSSIIAMSCAFCFFPAILYLILCRDKKRVSDTALVILLSIAIILTHTIAALVTLLTLVVVYISIKLFKKNDKLTVSYESVSLALITFFVLFMLFRWMQPPPGPEPFFDMNVRNLARTLQSQAQFVMTGSGAFKAVAPAVTVFNDGGYLLLLVFGVFGGLTYLHPRNRTGIMMKVVSSTAFLVIFPQILVVFAITNLLPDRWFMFTYVLLPLVAVSGLFYIASIIRGNIRKIGAISLIVLATMFIMTISSNANADSPMVFNGAQRLGFTQSELDAINTLCDIGSGRPVTDLYYGSTFPFVAGYDRYADLSKGDSRVFIQRNYYLQHPEWDRYYVQMIINIGPVDENTERVMISDYMHVWGIDNWPVIYRNNEVTVYSDALLLAQNR
jgi:hypothetical protein